MRSKSIYHDQKKHRAAKVLIVIGTLIVLAVLIYMAVDYPWRAVLINMGFSVQLEEQLPDPPPLPTFEAKPDSGSAEADVLEVTAAAEGDTAPNADPLAAQPRVFEQRPEIELQSLGIIIIPKIGISENIVEGTGQQLLFGVGHVKGTAMPGKQGNCVLAGHRNYLVMHPFRHLDKVETGDIIFIKHSEEVFRYEVFNILVTEPEDEWILMPHQDEAEVLTLITCTPVLNPTHRLVLQCRLMKAAQET